MVGGWGDTTKIGDQVFASNSLCPQGIPERGPGCHCHTEACLHGSGPRGSLLQRSRNASCRERRRMLRTQIQKPPFPHGSCRHGLRSSPNAALPTRSHSPILPPADPEEERERPTIQRARLSPLQGPRPRGEGWLLECQLRETLPIVPHQTAFVGFECALVRSARCIVGAVVHNLPGP